MPFQSNSAYELVRGLSFPRLVNTDGNRKSAEQIAAIFRANQLEVELENFTFSKFPMEIATRLLLGFYACLSVLALFLFPFLPWVSVAVSVGTVLLIALSARWHKSFEKLYDFVSFGNFGNFGKYGIGKKRNKQDKPKKRKKRDREITGRNVVARKKATSKVDLNLVFLAHYDSKSQLLSLGYRLLLLGLLILLFSAYAFTLVILAAQAGVNSFSISISISKLTFLTLLFNFCLILLTAILEFNFTANKSYGTLDNASGVGVILELARIFGKLRFRHLSLTFVATDAEEMGMAGALRFIQRHHNEFDPQSTIFINYDGIGSGKKILIISKRAILSYLQAEKGIRLTKLVLDSAKRCHIKARLAHLIFGIGFDHLPIAARGYKSITLTSARFRDIFKFHSKKDNMFQLEENAIDQAGQIGYELALQLEFEARRRRISKT